MSYHTRNFCHVVFGQSAPIRELAAIQQEAFDRLTPEERDKLALERIEFEREQSGVLSGSQARSHGGLFHGMTPAFPVLSKFHDVLESIEKAARLRVLKCYTDEERMQLAREEAEYARAFDKFQNDVQVLNSKPGHSKIYLPRPPAKGLILERFEREMRKIMEHR